MTIREFIKQEIDIDVCDNVYSNYYCAFCGPVHLTEEGEKYFADVLDYEITPYVNECVAIVDVDYYEDYREAHRKAKYFFTSMAGYCEDDLWNKWFYIDEV